MKKEQTATNATELARKTRREIKNRLGELDDIVNPNRLNTDWDADYKLPRPLQVGDHVLIKGIGEGDVLELGSKILVSSGMLKTRVKPTDLRLPAAQEENADHRPAHPAAHHLPGRRGCKNRAGSARPNGRGSPGQPGSVY